MNTTFLMALCVILSAIIAYYRSKISFYKANLKKAEGSLNTKHKLAMNALKLQALRKGDPVYISGKPAFQQGQKYYLLKFFYSTKGPAWYVGSTPEERHENPHFAVGLEHISLDPPKRCETCHQILNTNKQESNSRIVAWHDTDGHDYYRPYIEEVDGKSPADQAAKYYEELVASDVAHSVSLCQIIKSTDYPGTLDIETPSVNPAGEPC